MFAMLKWLFNQDSTTSTFKEKITHIRQNNASLTQLKLIGNLLTDQNIVDLCAALSTNKFLTDLDVSMNLFGNDAAEALANTTSLIYLNVSDNRISDFGTTGFINNATLLFLNISSNQIQRSGVQAFAANRKLRSLNIGYNEINDTDIQELAPNQTLTCLDISGTSVTNMSMKFFASKNTLKILHAGALNIDDAGAQILASSPSLTSLSLRHNCISSTGIQTFLTNKRLIHLDLRKNYITDIEEEKLNSHAINNKKNLIAFKCFVFIIINKKEHLAFSLQMVVNIGSFFFDDQHASEIIDLAIQRKKQLEIAKSLSANSIFASVSHERDNQQTGSSGIPVVCLK